MHTLPGPALQMQAVLCRTLFLYSPTAQNAEEKILHCRSSCDSHNQINGEARSMWQTHHKAVKVAPWEGEGGTAQTMRRFGPHRQSRGGEQPEPLSSSPRTAMSCRAKTLEGQCSFRYIRVTGVEESDPDGTLTPTWHPYASAGTQAPSRQHPSGLMSR